jgi:hypothetical protein
MFLWGTEETGKQGTHTRQSRAISLMMVLTAYITYLVQPVRLYCWKLQLIVVTILVTTTVNTS